MTAPQYGFKFRIKLPGGRTLVGRTTPQLKSGKSGNNAENRRRLWAHDCRCHWCRIVTVLPPPALKGRLSHFHATLDHVFGVESEQRDVIVLACHGCNRRRGLEGLEQARRKRRTEPERRANTLALMEGKKL